MKISKKKGAVIEWVIAAVLILLCTKYSFFAYGSFTALKAHQQSEKTYHYGPSQIIRTINLNGGKIYLCRYKKWFSADSVKKGIIKWYPGSSLGGYPIDYSKKASYSWSDLTIKNNVRIMDIFGYASDKAITRIVLEVDSNGTIKELKYDLDKSRMFIFYWDRNKNKYNVISLKGLDKNGEIIYEEKPIVP